MDDFNQALAGTAITPEAAFAIFDALEPASIPFMIGEWRGEPFASGHPMDGALEAAGWKGKRFESADLVHPLLFGDGEGGVFAVQPGKFMGAPNASPLLERRDQLETDRPAARLRDVWHRGVATAAMIYDDLPIIDVFRKVDDDTVLAVMDMRDDPRPYFFVLRRHVGA